MSDCCFSTSCKTDPKKGTCPVNGKHYKQVAYKTILHHIKKPWLTTFEQQVFYFCDDFNCEVVYFTENNGVIKQDDCRTEIGVKLNTPRSTICYCFGVSRSDAEQDSKIKKFVIEQTKKKLCDCEIRNPSGKCCLKDFPKSSF